MELHHIAVRAVFAFLTLLAILRVSGKRTIGEGTAFDFVLALIVGDMFDDVLWAELPASQFAVAVASLAVAHSMVSWLSFHNTPFHRLVNGEPAQLVAAGRPLATPMRREHVNQDDLVSMLRQQGLPDDTLGDAYDSRLELSGHLSVLKRWRARNAQKSDWRKRGAR